MSLPADQDLCDGRYRVERILGRGPSGVLCLATDLQSGAECALKRLYGHFHDAALLAAVGEDAAAARRLGHTAILTPSATGHDRDGSFYLVSELHRGDSLRSLLGRGPLPIAETMAILEPVCAALSAAHQAGLYHGDLVPANVLCGPDGARVTDFGMHRLGGHLGGWSGAVGYLPPEAYRGEVSGATARGDVFALGALLYECLLSQRLFEGPTAAAVMFKVCLSPLPSVDALLPPELGRIGGVVAMACAKDPQSRFETPAAFLRALRAVLEEPAPAPTPAAASPPKAAPPLLPVPAAPPPSLPSIPALPPIDAAAPALLSWPPPAASPPPGLPPRAASALVPAPRTERRVLGVSFGLGGLLMGAVLLLLAVLDARRRPPAPAPPAAHTASRQSEGELRAQLIYDEFLHAATNGQIDAAVALYRELPAGGPYRTRAREEFVLVRRRFEEAHLQRAQAALQSGLCDEVARHVEALRASEGDEVVAPTATPAAERLLERCHRRERRLASASGRRLQATHEIKDPYGSGKPRSAEKTPRE